MTVRENILKMLKGSPRLCIRKIVSALECRISNFGELYLGKFYILIMIGFSRILNQEALLNVWICFTA